MKKTNFINPKKGFTIIEVVLVLAIAGLIFAMVFVALPNLRKNQRDTQRRQEYAELASAVEAYITDHGGSMPGDDGTGNQIINATSVTSTGLDPNGYRYVVKIGTQATGGTNTFTTTIDTENNQNIIYIVKNASCNGSGKPETYSANARTYAIYGSLESGNGMYCQSYN